MRSRDGIDNSHPQYGTISPNKDQTQPLIGHAPDDGRASLKGGWRDRFFTPRAVFVLLFCINLLNYFDRGILGGVLPTLRDELHITKPQAGVLASAFTLGYTVTAPVFAWGDYWVRPTYLMVIGLTTWIISVMSTWLFGDIVSFNMLVFFRVLSGVGEASFCGLSPTVIDDNAPDSRRSTWLAVFFAGIPVGAAAGYAVSGFISKYLGWTSNFLIEGVLMIPLTILCVIVPVSRSASGKERDRGLGPKRPVDIDADINVPHQGGDPGAARIFRLLWSIFRNPIYIITCLGYGAFQFVLGALQNFVPMYFHEQMGIPVTEGDLIAGGMILVTGIFGTFIGGWLLDKMGGSKGDSGLVRSLRFSTYLMAVAFPFAFVAFTLKNLIIMLILISVGCFCAMGVQGAVNAAILTSVRQEEKNIAMAMSITIMHLTGDLPSPVIVGFLAQKYSTQFAMLCLMGYIWVSTFLWGGAWRISILRKRSNAAKRAALSEASGVPIDNGSSDGEDEGKEGASINVVDDDENRNVGVI